MSDPKHSPVHSEGTDEILDKYEYLVNAELSDKERSLTKQLTPKEKKYVKYVVCGYPKYKAYSLAFTGGKKVNRHASWPHTTHKKPIINELIDLLSDKMIVSSLLTRDKKRAILAEIATNPRNTPMEKIAAIRVDNKMTGEETEIHINTTLEFDKLYAKIKPTLGLPSPIEKEAIDI